MLAELDYCIQSNLYTTLTSYSLTQKSMKTHEESWKKKVMSTLFSATVRDGFIYLVSLRWPMAMEAGGSCGGAWC